LNKYSVLSHIYSEVIVEFKKFLFWIWIVVANLQQDIAATIAVPATFHLIFQTFAVSSAFDCIV